MSSQKQVLNNSPNLNLGKQTTSLKSDLDLLRRETAGNAIIDASDSPETIKALQRTLNAVRPGPDLPINGKFGPLTAQGILEYQKSKETLPDTGKFGGMTFNSIASDLAASKKSEPETSKSRKKKPSIAEVIANNEANAKQTADQVEIISRRNLTDKEKADLTRATPPISFEKVREVFKDADPVRLKTHYELVFNEMAKLGCTSKQIVAASLANIYCETRRFEPEVEKPSTYSTKGGGPPFNFSKYDGMTCLGNVPGNNHGALYCGRGFLQITGLESYRKMGKLLNIDLVKHPELATRPEIAAKIAAITIYNKKDALSSGSPPDYKKMRKAINGGYIGIEAFKKAYDQLIAE